MKSRWIVMGLSLITSLVATAESSKPNILYIMSDDHTSQSIGVYGSRLAKLNPTPTIDSISKEGIVMENAFCHNAICTPSRACIMTGQYSGLNGCPTLNDSLPIEKQYLPQEMKKAGYQTAIVGKWHLHKRPESFDYFKVLPGQGTYFDPVFFERGVKGTVVCVNPHNPARKLKFGPDAVQMKGHSSDCITDSALNWFKNKRDPNKPFFFCLQFKSPHDYFQYNPKYESYLENVEIPEPENMYDTKNNGSLATHGYHDELLPYIGTSVGRRNLRRNYAEDPKAPWAAKVDHSLNDHDLMHQTYQLYLKAYLRCVKGVDDSLKRVVDYLKSEGLYDNTIIIYTADQGFYLGEHDYIDKRWGYEEAMRMPFIVRYPKSIKPNTRSDAIIENVDFAPTLLDFAGVPTPSQMQGHSFKSILETGVEPASWKKAAYYHYWMHMAHHDNPAHIAIRTKRYKLIFFYGTGWQGESEPDTPPAWELYDLKNDPHEDNNLYDNPEYAPVIADLKTQLKDLRHKYKDDDPKFAFNHAIDEYWDYDEAHRLKAIQISHDVVEEHKNGTWRHNVKKSPKKKK